MTSNVVEDEKEALDIVPEKYEDIKLSALHYEEVDKDESNYLPAEMFVETEIQVVEDCSNMIFLNEDHIFQDKETFQKGFENNRTKLSLVIGNGKGEKKPFICNICNKSFARKAFLEGHTRTHTGERPYACEFCQSAFNDRSNLRKHTRIHFKVPPVTVDCEICNKTFFNINTLRKHARLHAGDKPYICEICSKSFSTKDSLTKHTQIHTLDRPFVCCFCFKSYTSSTSMSIHMRTHTGYRPFSCDICSKSFTQKIILKKHIYSHMKYN
ncbi:hypothetical protein C0J52_04048 [Blattella germanica]|nr:hypothetical protein C0J52_04048 [Blattella germanica]